MRLLKQVLSVLIPDLIESASHRASSCADSIKTYHNDSEMVLQLRLHGLVVEPLKASWVVVALPCKTTLFRSIVNLILLETFGCRLKTSGRPFEESCHFLKLNIQKMWYMFANCIKIYSEWHHKFVSRRTIEIALRSLAVSSQILYLSRTRNKSFDKYCHILIEGFHQIPSGNSRWRLCASMMKITSDKLNWCFLRYPVLCFKGLFVNKFTIAFCMWWCFALSAAEPVACIPAINTPQGILTL
ncbi:hypothetical protein OUZ56_002256 [Daphnia magna]|uniref:Uncharacterized protein n=1 Tax=Daphnia magna TaxID=35525 RepID=A0ABR0A5F0_9CRUS|nr:hypothetical protein OUZ56_002256 [Daphnia magna]